MKRILILGVNGFIGHHLSKRILGATDWEVYGMDMQSDRVEDLVGERRFHFFEGDITINKEWIEYHVRKCDTVLPLVAIATPAAYVRDPLRVFELDFEANLPIVRACVQHRKRLVFPSTSEVYGMSSDRQFDPEEPNASWVADVTYIPTREGWLYLAVVEDLFSRMVVGWSMDATMTSRLVVHALEMALARRLKGSSSSGLIAHSDRGSQYASEHYRRRLCEERIACSMSRRGNCWDNAPMESFFASLKKELVHDEDYAGLLPEK